MSLRPPAARLVSRGRGGRGRAGAVMASATVRESVTLGDCHRGGQGRGGVIRVEVTDRAGPGAPQLRPASGDAEGGRGLQLVASLASVLSGYGGMMFDRWGRRIVRARRLTLRQVAP